jgi:hypothetical protein
VQPEATAYVGLQSWKASPNQRRSMRRLEWAANDTRSYNR